MLNWINMPQRAGHSSRQAHTDLPEGSYEREMGRDGFFGPSSHIYHSHPPTSWEHISGPLKPRAFDSTQLTPDRQKSSPWDAWPLFKNRQIQIRLWKTDQAMSHLVRNADGDELLFIHQGQGALFCDFGHLNYVTGDYIVIPRGTLWRIEPDLDHQPETIILMIEASDDAYKYPDKGIIGQHAVYDPGILDTPQLNQSFRQQQTERAWDIIIKRQNQYTAMTYPYNPLDAIGWQGTLCVLRLNWKDIRPVMSHRYHIPPSAHSTFATQNFVVCTFCPRPLESDPGALRVPFYHSNDDYDELIFYHKGEFFSRDNIYPGMFTLHPCGFPHGPHPKAFAAGKEMLRKHTDEVAVMVDTRQALDITEQAHSIEWEQYWESWK